MVVVFPAEGQGTPLKTSKVLFLFFPFLFFYKDRNEKSETLKGPERKYGIFIYRAFKGGGLGIVSIQGHEESSDALLSHQSLTTSCTGVCEMKEPGAARKQ